MSLFVSRIEMFLELATEVSLWGLRKYRYMQSLFQEGSSILWQLIAVKTGGIVLEWMGLKMEGPLYIDLMLLLLSTLQYSKTSQFRPPMRVL